MLKKILFISLIFSFFDYQELQALEITNQLNNNLIIENSIQEEIIIEESKDFVYEEIIDENNNQINENNSEKEENVFDENIENNEDIENIDLSEYYSLLDMLGELEVCAQDYINQRDYNSDRLKYKKRKLIYTYIRSKRYNSSLWQFLAGEIDNKFNDYVKQNNPNLESLKTLGDITIPSGEKVDFIHMFASIDMHNEGYGCVGSWGGDLVQVIEQLKNESGTKEELYELFKASINVPGYFSNEDMNGDLDSFNIYKRSRKISDPINKILEDYYLEISNEKRINEFIDNKYTFDTYNKEKLKEFVSMEFLYDRYIKLLLDYKDISLSLHELHIITALDVFIDYLYSIYNGVQVNNVKEEIPEVDKKPIKENQNTNQTVVVLPKEEVVIDKVIIDEKTEEIIIKPIIYNENIQNNSISKEEPSINKNEISEEEKEVLIDNEINNVVEIEDEEVILATKKDNKESNKEDFDNYRKIFIGIGFLMILIICITPLLFEKNDDIDLNN